MNALWVELKGGERVERQKTNRQKAGERTEGSARAAEGKAGRQLRDSEAPTGTGPSGQAAPLRLHRLGRQSPPPTAPPRPTLPRSRRPPCSAFAVALRVSAPSPPEGENRLEAPALNRPGAKGCGSDACRPGSLLSGPPSEGRRTSPAAVPGATPARRASFLPQAAALRLAPPSSPRGYGPVPLPSPAGPRSSRTRRDPRTRERQGGEAGLTSRLLPRPAPRILRALHGWLDGLLPTSLRKTGRPWWLPGRPASKPRGRVEPAGGRLGPRPERAGLGCCQGGCGRGAPHVLLLRVSIQAPRRPAAGIWVRARQTDSPGFHRERSGGAPREPGGAAAEPPSLSRLPRGPFCRPPGTRRPDQHRQHRRRPPQGAMEQLSCCLLLLLLTGCLISRPAGGQCPGGCACSRSAQVECTGPQIVAVPGPLPPNTMSLQILSTYITTLEDAAFGNASILIALRMEKNALTSLSPGAFQGLGSLRYLSLASNQIQGLPLEVFQGLGRLEALLLSGNRLLHIHPAHFAPLSGLRELQLHGNELQAVPPGTFDPLPFLTKLNLARNRLARLPAQLFAPLRHLQVLRLYENQLEEVSPGAFHTLTELQELGLHQNQLREIPPGLFSANRKLQKLFLSHNQIEVLPAGLFLELPELIRLTLFGNAVRELPPGLFGPMPGLRELWLYGNRLATLSGPAFRNLTGLRLLVLSRNQLRSISPSALAGLGELQEMSLHTNQLHTLEEETFQGLGRLQNLSLQNNRLRSLPGHLFRDTAGLVTLQLQNNSFETLQASVFDGLPNLRELRLHDNPWHCDAALLSLQKWLRENPLRLGSSPPVCALPPLLQGESIAELNEEHLGPALPRPVSTSAPTENPSQNPGLEKFVPVASPSPLDNEAGSAEVEQEFRGAVTDLPIPGMDQAKRGIWGLTRTQTGVVVTCMVVGCAALLGAVAALAVYSGRRQRHGA